MKWICMLLLVANLGFCGWAMNTELRHAATRARPLDLAAGMPSLTLLRELPELPARGESASNPDQTAPDGDAIDESISIFDPNPMLPSANLCVAAGPLADASQSVRLRDWLAARAVRVVAEVRAVRTRQLYTVFLEERDSAATTGPVSERRAEEPEHDSQIRRGALAATVSLGLFATQDAVNARLGDMQRPGYQPVVVPQYESRREYWIRAELGAGFEETNMIPPELGIDAVLTRSRCIGFR